MNNRYGFQGNRRENFGYTDSFENDQDTLIVLDKKVKHQNKLPEAVLARMEKAFGTDFSGINIYEDSKATQVGALAYAKGNDIYFAPGKFNLNTPEGLNLLGHELAHVVQQRQGRVEATTLAKGIPVNDDAMLENEADRMGRQAAEGLNVTIPGFIPDAEAVIAKDTIQRYTDPDGNILPDPIEVTWNGDKFRLEFSRTEEDMTRFNVNVKYTGIHHSDKASTLSMSIGSAKIESAVVINKESTIGLDFYGDGTKIVKITEKARVENKNGKKGRTHTFDLKDNGYAVASTEFWVEDANAKAIKERPEEEVPGENPGFHYLEASLSCSADIDGDGDQHKELNVLLNPLSFYEAGETKDCVKQLQVQLTQKSSGKSLSYTFDLPKPSTRGSLFPLLETISDGKVPTEISLILPSDTLWMKIFPPKNNKDGINYIVDVGGKPVSYKFPQDKVATNDLFTEGRAGLIGNIVSYDMKVGAYNDKYRLTLAPKSLDKAVLGISALYRGESTAAQGVEININNKLVAGILNDNPVCLTLDLNGDGIADLQIFDSLSTPSENDPGFIGGGGAESNRIHKFRISGTAINAGKIMTFTIKSGVPIHGDSPTAIDKEATANALAINTLSDQKSAGSFTGQMDLYERALMAVRKKAADDNIINQATFKAWARLSESLIKIIPQSKGKVNAALQSEAFTAANEFYTLFSKDTLSKAKPGMSFGGGSSSYYNPYTKTSVTAAAFYSDTRGPGIDLPKNIQAGNWSSAFSNYHMLVSGFDEWVAESLKDKKGKYDKDAKNAGALSAKYRELSEIEKYNPKRILAVFHPDEKMKSEQDFTSEVPLDLYYYKLGDTWHLRDLTNPEKTWDYTQTAKAGETEIPLSLIQQLNDPDHFPLGVIHYEVPGFRGGQVKTQDFLTWKTFFTYLGLGLAVAGMVLSLGSGAVAVAGAWALVGSGVAGAIASGIDLAEHIKHGNLDATTALIDVSQIVAGLAGASAIGMGRIVKMAGSAPQGARWAGAYAKAALLADRYVIPMTKITAAADITTFAVMTVDTVKKLDDIEHGGGNQSDKDRAKLLMLSQLLLMGGLTALSLKGTIADIKKGRSLILEPGPDGVPVIRDAKEWYFEQPKIKAILDKEPKLKLALEENPDVIYKMIKDPDVKEILIRNPKVTESFVKHPEAIKMLDEVLAEVDSKGAEAIIKEGKVTPTPTKLTASQKSSSETISKKYNPKDDIAKEKTVLQNGFDKTKIGNKEYLETYLNKLYAESEVANKELEKLTNAIAGKTNGKAGFRPEAKSRKRSLEKIEDEYKGDASKLLDLSGSKIVYDSLEDLYKGLAEAEKELGGKIIQIKDRFISPEPSGYRDILMNIKMSNGHIAEFRLHLSQIDAVANSEHALYEIIRSFKPLAAELGTGVSERQTAIMLTIRRKTNKMFDVAISTEPQHVTK